MNERQTVTFSIEGRQYAVKTEDLYRIIAGDIPVTSLPLTDDYVLGVINFEGEILPVLSVNNFFKVSSKGPDQTKSIIILKNEDNRLGLLVEGKVEFISRAADTRDLVAINSDFFKNYGKS